MPRLVFSLILSAVSLGLLPLNTFAEFDAVQQATITGILERAEIAGEKTYWLKLDEPLVSARGSRSERTVEIVTLLVPADMQGKASEFEGRHVAASGTMECRLLYTPWSATCDMRVREIVPTAQK